ncbi:hypothetical protein DN402_32520 [Streptomyces sp. SW4]|nr:hypothetical protein DN402_32520 [Streptomyces sp. SW4]
MPDIGHRSPAPDAGPRPDTDTGRRTPGGGHEDHGTGTSRTGTGNEPTPGPDEPKPDRRPARADHGTVNQPPTTGSLRQHGYGRGPRPSPAT